MKHIMREAPGCGTSTPTVAKDIKLSAECVYNNSKKVFLRINFNWVEPATPNPNYYVIVMNHVNKPLIVSSLVGITDSSNSGDLLKTTLPNNARQVSIWLPFIWPFNWFPVGEKVGIKIWGFTSYPIIKSNQLTGKITELNNGAVSQSDWGSLKCDVAPPTDFMVECSGDSDFKFTWNKPHPTKADFTTPPYIGAGQFRYHIQTRNNNVPSDYQVVNPRYIVTRFRVSIVDTPTTFTRARPASPSGEHSFRIRMVYSPRGMRIGNEGTYGHTVTSNLASEWSDWVTVNCDPMNDGTIALQCRDNGRVVNVIRNGIGNNDRRSVQTSLGETFKRESRSSFPFPDLDDFSSYHHYHSSKKVWVITVREGTSTAWTIPEGVSADSAIPNPFDRYATDRFYYDRYSDKIYEVTAGDPNMDIHHIPVLPGRVTVTYEQRWLHWFTDVVTDIREEEQEVFGWDTLDIWWDTDMDTAPTEIREIKTLGIRWFIDSKVDLGKTATATVTCLPPMVRNLRAECASDGKGLTVRWDPLYWINTGRLHGLWQHFRGWAIDPLNPSNANYSKLREIVGKAPISLVRPTTPSSGTYSTEHMEDIIGENRFVRSRYQYKRHGKLIYNSLTGRWGIHDFYNSIGYLVSLYTSDYLKNHEYRYEIEERSGKFPTTKVHYDNATTTSIISDGDTPQVKIHGHLLFYHVFTAEPGATYEYRVRRIHVPTGMPTGDDGSKSEWTAWKTVKCPGSAPPPSTPSFALTCTNNRSEVTATWRLVNGATFYNVEYAKGEYPVSTVATRKTFGSVTTDSLSVEKNARYWVRVQAGNSGGTSPWSQWANIVCRSLSPPSGLTVVCNASGNRVTASWNAVSGVTRYEMDTTGDNIVDWSGTTTTHSYTVTPASTHNIRMRTVTSAGTSPWSAIVSQQCSAPPPTPTFTLSCTNNRSSITVSWRSVSGADSYTVEYVKGELPTSPTVATHITSGRVTTDSLSVDKDARYWVRVQASNSVGASPWSNPAPKTCRSLSPPSGLTVACNAAGNQVTVTWNAVSGATGYEIDLTGDNDAEWRGTGTTHSYPVTPAAGSEHRARMRTVVASDTSPWSAWHTTATCEPPPIEGGGNIPDTPPGKVTMTAECVAEPVSETDPTPTVKAEMTVTVTVKEEVKETETPVIGAGYYTPVSVMRGWPAFGRGMWVDVNGNKKYDTKGDTPHWWRIHYTTEFLKNKGYVYTDVWKSVDHPRYSDYGGEYRPVWALDTLTGPPTLAVAFWSGGHYSITTPESGHTQHTDPYDPKYDGQENFFYSDPRLPVPYHKDYIYGGADKSEEKYKLVSVEPLPDDDTISVYSHEFIYTFDARTRAQRRIDPGDKSFYELHLYPSEQIDEATRLAAAVPMAERTDKHNHLHRDLVKTLKKNGYVFASDGSLKTHKVAEIVDDKQTSENEAIMCGETSSEQHTCPIGWVQDYTYPHSYNCCIDESDHKLWMGGGRSCLDFCLAYINPNAVWVRGIGCGRMGSGL